MGARRREEGVRGLKEEGWAMADKDKKKLKVILKLPPKSSSSAQPKSSPAAATAPPAGAGGGASAVVAGGGGANASSKASSSSVAAVARGFAFSGLPAGSAEAGVAATTITTASSHHHQFLAVGGSKEHHHQPKHHRSSGSGSRNLQSGRHGVLLPQGSAAAIPETGGAVSSSSGPTVFHTAVSSNSVRFSGNSSAGGPSSSLVAAAGGGASFGHFSSPPASSTHHAHAPVSKKRKFKTVEHAGDLGVGAVIVGRAGGSGAAIASDGPGFGRDAGGEAGGLTRVGGGGGTGGTGAGGVGGKGGQGGGREGGGKEGAAGGRTGLPPAASPLPVKKSHKKQVKPSGQTDGSQAFNPFAGVIMPEKTPSEPLSKTMLEGVLEKLQKKDTYAVFAEPVDASQVPDYYDIIKEPMDFGTMRKKIKKGSYRTVEEFEGDIYLICSNAMRYNGPETIYYKQARAIRDMARKALEGIRAQLAGEIRKPVSHKKKQSPSSKKPHTKKPTLSKVRLDGTGSDFASGATLAGDGELSRGWSNSTLDTGKAKKGLLLEKLVGLVEDSQDAWVSQPLSTEGQTETQEEPSGATLKPMGPKDGRRPLSTEEYHRNTYKQRLLPAHGHGPPLAAIGGESRQLVPVGNQVEHAYAKSLAKFGAGLGPKAWLFIAKRLELLNTPIVQPGIPSNSVVSDKLTAPLPSQAGVTANSHPPAGGQSGGFGVDRASSPSHSGQVVDGIPSRPSGVEHRGQVIDSTHSRPSGVPYPGQVVDSTPSVPSVASDVGQAVVSSPSDPTGASLVAQPVVSIPSQTTGVPNVSEAVVYSQNHPSSGSQVGQALVSTSKIPPGGALHIENAAISTPNHPYGSSQAAVSSANFPFGPSHVGQAVRSNPSSSGPLHVGQPGGSSLTSSGTSHVGQAAGSSFGSSGPVHVVQTPTSFPVAGPIGTTDRTPVKNLQRSSHQGEGSSATQQERGNGRLDNARSDPESDSLVHTSGTKQILGLDSDVASEENIARRLGWGPTGVDQAVSSFALVANSKAFSQAWSATPLKQGSTSYAYAPMPSSAGRDEANAQAQAWAQARVMSLTNPADVKRNLSREAQVLGFLPQSRELSSDFATNLPQILQSNVSADYNSRPRQSPGNSLSTAPIPPNQDQQLEAFGSKSGAPDQKSSSLRLHSQGSIRPAQLQQSSLQQRAMPPDLNVALLSPSALQSPPQPGSTQTSARHPDLKLQL